MLRFPQLSVILVGLVLVGEGAGGCGSRTTNEASGSAANPDASAANQDAGGMGTGEGSTGGRDSGSSGTGQDGAPKPTGADGGAGGSDAAIAGDAAPPWTIGTSCLFEDGGTPAFCDDFSEGASPGGRGGDLDDQRWAVARVTGTGAQNFVAFPPTPVSACKVGVTTATADDDLLLCDPTSGHGGQLLTAMSAQNYAIMSMRPRQPFDFAGRTGAVVFNVDAVTEGGLSWWTSLYITDEPYSSGNNVLQVTGTVPRNGIGINLDSPCDGTSGCMIDSIVSVGNIFTYNQYAETVAYVTNNTGAGAKTQRGSLNHIEIRLSSSSVEVWASDFSQDGGKTYPNFQLLASATISLPFTRGYVHFQQNERAPIKYDSSLPYTNNYWSGMGFDGPVLGGEVAYQVPDALTPGPGSGNTGNGGSTGDAPNLGYPLLTSPQSTNTCCDEGGSLTPVPPFTLQGVHVAGVAHAELTFTVGYVMCNGSMPSTMGLQYRWNGTTWRTPSVMPDLTAALACEAWCGGNSLSPANWAVAYAFPVEISDLLEGANTLEFATSGTCDSYPPGLANIDLLMTN